MYAYGSESHVLRLESEMLIAKLLRVANALKLVEDRRADLLIRDASSAESDELSDMTGEAARCAAVVQSATDLVARVSGLRRSVVPLSAGSLLPR